MMVRLAAFVLGSLIWRTEEPTEEETVFRWLFYLEFLDWLGSRRVTDTIVNEKTLVIADALTNFFSDYNSKYHLGLLTKEELQERTRQDSRYSKVTYQAFKKEYLDGQLSSYILNSVLKRRKAQSGRVPDHSVRKRSSEDSKGNKEKNFHGIPITNEVPYVREVEKNKLQELVILLPSVRRTSLQEFG